MIKKQLWITLPAAFALLLGAAAAQAGVVGSKHDFTVATGSGNGSQGQTDATDEVCVFCHTPHGSADTAAVPLWNKVLPTTNYTRYSSLNLPSFTSEEAPVGSVSLACLSCHDGTQAMDVVLNSPGSGGYNAGGAEIDAARIGQMSPEPVPALGSDLSNDHPVSMQYAAGGCVAGDTDGPCPGPLGDADFKLPVKATVNQTTPIWWVNGPTGSATVREKTDMLLYARDIGGVVQPTVECGSCHDPHNDTTGSASSVQFLRVANDASQICTACHSK